MNFTVSSSELAGSLQAICKVINPKTASVSPILQNVLFRVEGNQLTLTASDNDTTLETRVTLAECDADGQIAVPAKTLLDALKEISDQPLSFEIDESNGSIIIKYLNGLYNMIGVNANEYPLPAVVAAENNSIEISASVFLNGLTRCIFATADDELRPVMNGIFLDIEPESITFVASDGHKLVCNKNTSNQPGIKASFILPKRPANVIKSLISADTETVSICFDNRIAVITAGNFQMVCLLIEGKYPNYNAVIPKNNPYKMTIERQALASALRRVSVFAPANSGLIRMNIKSDNTYISAQNLDFSTSANETMACQYDGNTMSIGFKAQFLIETVNNMPGQEVVMNLSDSSRACVLVPAEQEEGDNLLMLLMPMVMND